MHKKILLSNLAKISDPLGIISSVTLFIKHVIQRLWNCNLSWYEWPDILCSWDKYTKDFLSLQYLSLPRRLSSSNFCRFKLYGFGDASEKGYCAIIDFVWGNSSGQCQSIFVASKFKITPLESLPPPRLELLFWLYNRFVRSLCYRPDLLCTDGKFLCLTEVLMFKILV